MPAAEIKKFWEQTRASLAEVDLNATVEPVEETDVFTMEGRIKTRTIYRVIMSSFEGRQIIGKALFPRMVQTPVRRPIPRPLLPGKTAPSLPTPAPRSKSPRYAPQLMGPGVKSSRESCCKFRRDLGI